MFAEFCAKSEYGLITMCRAAHQLSHNGWILHLMEGDGAREMMIATKMLFILLMKIMMAVMYQPGCWPRTPEL